MSQRFALAIRHVHFEDLGTFADPIRKAGFDIQYVDAESTVLRSIDPLSADLLVVLGGPVSVYDDEDYPFLKIELELLAARLEAEKPTLGICLGAQLMARALGAQVYPGKKELGWAPLRLSSNGHLNPLVALNGLNVLHWHGDTFELPRNTDLLASTDKCAHQAFSRGTNVLGLQFHCEVRERYIERWLVGHAHELFVDEISPLKIRTDTAQFGPRLEPAAKQLLETWIENVKF